MKRITMNLIVKFREYLLFEEKSKATVEKYIRDVTAFMGWVAERNVQKSTVLEYKKELVDKYAPRSVNSVISSCRLPEKASCIS